MSPTVVGDNRGMAKERGRRGGWRRPIGWLLILVGLAMIGYVAWEFYGTNIVAQHKHREITSDLRQQWKKGHDFASVEDGDAPIRADALIRIPRFGEDYVVPVLEGVGDSELAAGFGHFEDTADAGKVGNYAVAAHRVTHGQPLREMPDLQPGDQVIVETRVWVYTYVLDTGGDDLVVPFTDGWVLEPLPHNPDGGVEPPQTKGGRLITLTTCSELFHTDNRMVAFGHLVQKERR